MPQEEKIDFGYTFDFFIPAVFTFFFGGLCFFVHYILAVLIIAVAILMLLPKTGIEIDNEGKRVRKYYNLFSKYYGEWYQMSTLLRIELRRTHVSQSLNYRGGQRTLETKTYDLLLIDNQKGEKELHEFSDYNFADKVSKLIAESGSLEYHNKIQEIRSAALKRRSDKNYRK